jgi:hypothetical protein
MSSNPLVVVVFENVNLLKLPSKNGANTFFDAGAILLALPWKVLDCGQCSLLIEGKL